MVNWYKGKTFVFKLKDTLVKEDFCLWKAWKNTSDCSHHFVDGVEKFPLKEGMSVKGVDEKVYMVEDTKFINKKVWGSIFPALSKSSTFIRTVLIGGLEYNYRFKKSLNDQIIALIGLSGGEVPKAHLKQTFFPNETPSKMYQLKPVSITEATTWEGENLEATSAQTGTSKSVDSLQKDAQKIEIAGITPSSLTAFEQGFIDQIKALPNKLDESVFAKSFIVTAGKYGEAEKYSAKQINITDRAKILFKKYNE